MKDGKKQVEIDVVETDTYKSIQKLIGQKKHTNFEIKYLNRPSTIPEVPAKLENEKKISEDTQKLCASKTEENLLEKNDLKNDSLEKSEKTLLQKRSHMTFSDQDLIKDPEILKKLKSNVIKKISYQENRSMVFMKDYREKVEKWKTDIILRKGKKVSFNIQDIDSIDSKICDFHPRMDIFYKKYNEGIFVRKSKLFEVSPDQLNKEIYLNSVVNSVWTINDLINFAEYHITEVNNGNQYFDMVEDARFTNRFVPNLQDLHKIQRIPFKLKFFRKEYKHCESFGKEETLPFQEELRNDILKYMSNVIKCRLTDNRISDLLPIECQKFTVEEVEKLLR